MFSLSFPFLGAIVLGFATWRCYVRCGSWLSPEVFFGAIWTLALSVSVLMGFGYYFSAALALPVVGVLSFQLGSLLAPSPFVADGRWIQAPLFFPRTFFVAAAIAGFAGVYLHLKSGDISLEDYTEREMGDSVRAVAAQQYSATNRLDGTSQSKLLNATLLAAAFAAGMLRSISPNAYRHNLWLLLLLAPGLLKTALTTTRNDVLIPLLNYGGGITAGLLYCNMDRLFSPSMLLKRLAPAIPFLFAILAVPAMIRNNADSSQTLETLDKLRAWVAGSQSAFCVWYDHYYLNSPEYYSNIFLEPFAAQLGLSEPHTLVAASESYSLGYSNHESNAATIFKSLIGQFGAAGMIFFCLLSGLFFAVIAVACRRGSLLSAGVLAGLYSVMLISGNGSYLAIGRRNYGIIILLCYLVLCKLFTNQSKPRSVPSPIITPTPRQLLHKELAS